MIDDWLLIIDDWLSSHGKYGWHGGPQADDVGMFWLLINDYWLIIFDYGFFWLDWCPQADGKQVLIKDEWLTSSSRICPSTGVMDKCGKVLVEPKHDKVEITPDSKAVITSVSGKQTIINLE